MKGWKEGDIVAPSHGETATPFSTTLRSAISARRITLSALSHQLSANGTPVSVSALSHWSSGRRQPEQARSIEALTVLEDLLGLGSGELTDLVGPPRPRGRNPRVVPVSQAMPETGLVAKALGELGFMQHDELPYEQTVHEKLLVDAVGVERTLEFRHIVRALSPGPIRLPSIHVVDEVDPAAFSTSIEDHFEAVAGCKLGRTVLWPEHGLMGAELILAEDARRGDIAVVDHRIQLPPSALRAVEATYSVPRRTREVLIQVEFAGELPATAEEYVDLGEGEIGYRLDVRPNRLLQLMVQDVGPGLVGIRWTWPDDGVS